MSDERKIKNEKFTPLVDARQFIKNNDIEVNYNSMNISQILANELVSDSNDTISLFYSKEKKTCTLLIEGIHPNRIIRKMSPDDYLSICNEIGIQENDNYNMSKNLYIKNIYVRVFALTRPISDYPNITISTAKEAPASWDQKEIDHILRDIAGENFILIGASGAGKTYLMNYMLKKRHQGTNYKIGIIEEFSELFCPNESTSKVLVPAPKPNEPRLLQFITEQSNLMRLKYLYVGEVKGPEAWPLVSNLASGTKGGCTLHGSSIRQGLNRLKNLCLLSGTNNATVEESISKSIKYAIYLENHRVKEIAMLTGPVQNGNFQLREIWSNK